MAPRGCGSPRRRVCAGGRGPSRKSETSREKLVTESRGQSKRLNFSRTQGKPPEAIGTRKKWEWPACVPQRRLTTQHPETRPALLSWTPAPRLSLGHHRASEQPASRLLGSTGDWRLTRQRHTAGAHSRRIAEGDARNAFTACDVSSNIFRGTGWPCWGEAGPE